MNTRPAFKTKEGKEAILGIYDAVLSNWPFPHEILKVETRYGNTHVIACGDKANPPLILIHGSSFNSLMWLGDMPHYAKDFRVYAVDVPGEPGKSGDIQYPLKGPVYHEWLDDVINGLQINKVSLIGLSLGGWMVLNYSSHHPEKVEKLAMLCPSGIGPQKFSIFLKLIVYSLGGKKGTDRLFREISGEQPEEVTNYSKLISKNFNRRNVVPLFKDEEIKRLKMPVSLIVAENDVLLDSKKTVKRAQKLLPQAEITMMPGAAHALINLAGKVTDFLKKD